MAKKTTTKAKTGSSKSKSSILIIVESPTKARTISGFLGSPYRIESSFGHIRDLPKSKLGIDEETFEPSYVIPTKARKRVNELKKEAAAAEKVILATDEDREGEAIAWHLTEALNLDGKNTERIAFHEITKSAIEEALSHPRQINDNLVNAQAARRTLDRLVGYKLSPFLWKKVMSGLSAGRVQSAAVRLVAEREEEIRRFISETYFTVSADFLTEKTKDSFSSSLAKINGKSLPKPGIKTEAEAKQVVSDLERSSFTVIGTEIKEIKKTPNPPFTTSTLQQESSKRLRLSAKMTMSVAQGLYEKGFITYMRTDSVNLSNESLSMAAEWIKANLGAEYATESPRRFKTKSKTAQEAHEAIRPTDPFKTPESLPLEDKDRKLYDLIWRRFIASQLPQAVFESNKVIIEADAKADRYELTTTGSRIKKEGFLKIWPTSFEETILPDIKKGSHPELVKTNYDRHETEPPARYNEASLIKALEEYGIGRPSTYASIVSVIQDRRYVEKNEAKRFAPTETGEIVNKILVEHFPEIVDIKFTASVEEKLDEIAEGSREWKQALAEFYIPFAKRLAEKYESVEKRITEEPSDEVCDKCGRPMIIKNGRFGKFLACTGYPECKNTKKLIKPADEVKTEGGDDIVCPKCGEGKVVRKRTKRGRFFYGCTRYPDCDYASWQKPGEEKGQSEESEKEETEE